LLKGHVKQQKTTIGISNLFAASFRGAVQKMLKAEMDNHLAMKTCSELRRFPTATMVKPAKK